MGIPLYVFSGVLLLAGLLEGLLVTTFQALELFGIALLIADAWGVRRRTPVLNSSDKAVAAGGWVLLIVTAIALSLALPVL